MEKNVLNQIFNEKDFKTSELEIIYSKFKEVHYKKGDFLLKEGETEHLYWFVQSGMLRSYVIDTEGNDISTNFYSTGDIVIDWPSFFLRTGTKEFIQALTDCVCWQLDYETFQQLFNSIEAFRESGRYRLVKSYFDLKKHTTSLITDPAKERYLNLIAEKPQIFQVVSLKQIASYLGITDTSLSRIRKEVSEENM